MDTFDELDDKWHYFKSCLFSVLDRYAPLKSVTSKFSKRPTPWMTPKLFQAIKVKNKAKWFAFKTRDPHDIAAYKSLKNKSKPSIHEAKLSYVKLLIQESKHNPNLSSQLWNSVNDIIGRSKSCDSVISAYNFFCNVAITDDHQPTEQFVASTSFTLSSFQFAPFSPDTVFHMLQHLDLRKSTGSDGLFIFLHS